MRTSRTVALAGLAIALLASTGCKKKLKFEATATGYKPDGSKVVVVHLTTTGGATVTCTSMGLECPRTDIPGAGQTDVEISLDGVNASKANREVFLKAEVGKGTPFPQQAEVKLDLDTALPPRVDVDDGKISCIGRKCEGTLVIWPASWLKAQLPPGTIAEVGTERFTADAKGNIDAPVTKLLPNAIKDLPLKTLCAFAPPAPLGTTSLKLTFPGGAKASTTVTFPALKAADYFADATPKDGQQGPIAFAWEKPGVSSAKRRASLAMTRLGCTPGGDADATVGDVTVLTTSVETPPRTGKCEYEITARSSGASRGTSTGTLTMHDEQQTAYERVTGKKLGTRLFQAPRTCTSSMELKGVSASVDQHSQADGRAIAAWALTFVR